MNASICGSLLQIKLFGGGINLAPLPANLDPQVVEKTLYRMFTPEWLRDTVVSHRVLNLMRQLFPEKSERFTPLRWAELFYTSAPDLLKLVLAFEGIELDTFTMLMFYAGEGIDPNVNRECLLSPWVKPVTITS
jgi:hypothetical protein